MKYLVSSTIIWLSAFFPAQQISFDVLQEVNTVHSHGRNRESSSSLRLVNSQSGNFIQLQRNGYKYLTSIYDPAAGLLHYFNVYTKDKALVPVYSNSYRQEAYTRLQTDGIYNNLKTTVVSETAPLEYEVKVFGNKRDRKPEYIFRIKLEKAKYTDLVAGVDNTPVTAAVEQSLIKELSALPCCYRIISYEGTREKGGFSTKYSVAEETPMDIVFTIPEILRMGTL